MWSLLYFLCDAASMLVLWVVYGISYYNICFHKGRVKPCGCFKYRMCHTVLVSQSTTEIVTSTESETKNEVMLEKNFWDAIRMWKAYLTFMCMTYISRKRISDEVKALGERGSVLSALEENKQVVTGAQLLSCYRSRPQTHKHKRAMSAFDRTASHADPGSSPMSLE